MRTCKVCSEEKELGEFRQPKSNMCRSCEKEYNHEKYIQNKEQDALRRKLYYEENKTIIREKQAEYWKLNSEKFAAKKREYWNKNKDSLKEKNRERYNLKKKEYTNQKKAYRRTPNGKVAVNAADRKRRALKLSNLHPNHNPVIEQVLELSRQRLEKCLGIQFHLDHIIPLSKGGQHYHLNLQVLPATINLRKGDNLAFDNIYLNQI